MKKVGLALSGGGIRGIAHIGVLKVLIAESIPVDCITGTSMGGIVGAFFARQGSIAEGEAAALRLSKFREVVRLLKPISPGKGLMDQARVRDFLTPYFQATPTFSDLALPLGVVAVDLVHPREIILKEGNVLDAVLATSAVPGVFPPVEIGEGRLVDGGILNNLPVALLPDFGAEIRIAVDVQIDPFTRLPWQEASARPQMGFPLPDSFLDFYRSELIMVNRLMHTRVAEIPPHVLIRPEIPDEITLFSGYQRMESIIQAGEEAGRAALPAIRKLL